MKLFSKILMLAAIACAFCSCEKEGDDNNGTSTPKEVKISYKFSNTEDFFDLMNVRVEYMDSNGALKTETINKDWKYEATVPYASAPKEYKFTVIYSAACQGLEETKDSYTIQQEFIGHVYKVMSDGNTKNLGYTILADNIPKSFSGEKINGYLKIHENELSLPFECSLEE